MVMSCTGDHGARSGSVYRQNPSVISADTSKLRSVWAVKLQRLPKGWSTSKSMRGQG